MVARASEQSRRPKRAARVRIRLWRLAVRERWACWKWLGSVRYPKLRDGGGRERSIGATRLTSVRDHCRCFRRRRRFRRGRAASWDAYVAVSAPWMCLSVEDYAYGKCFATDAVMEPALQKSKTHAEMASRYAIVSAETKTGTGIAQGPARNEVATELERGVTMRQEEEEEEEQEEVESRHR